MAAAWGSRGGVAVGGGRRLGGNRAEGEGEGLGGGREVGAAAATATRARTAGGAAGGRRLGRQLEAELLGGRGREVQGVPLRAGRVEWHRKHWLALFNNWVHLGKDQRSAQLAHFGPQN